MHGRCGSMDSKSDRSFVSHGDAAHARSVDLACILVVSPEALAALLQLPPGSLIDAVDVPCDQPGVLHLRLRGSGWPSTAGAVLRTVTGTVTRRLAADGSVLRDEVAWGFPAPVESNGQPA